MTYKQCAQASLVIGIDFKRENAEYQIDEIRHSFDASAVPGPYLGTDIVNNLLSWRLPPQSARETQIETWVINEDDRVGFALPNLLKRFAKLLSEIAIFPKDFP